MEWIIETRLADGTLVDTIDHPKTDAQKDATVRDCIRERLADDHGAIVGILYVTRADLVPVIDHAAEMIQSDYDRWSEGKDFSPDERDNIYRAIEALRAADVCDEAEDFPHLSLSQLADDLHERHSEGDWESCEPIARWILRRLVPDAIRVPIESPMA